MNFSPFSCPIFLGHPEVGGGVSAVYQSIAVNRAQTKHSALDRMLEHVLPIRFAEVVEREDFWGTCPEFQTRVSGQARLVVMLSSTPLEQILSR
jgi:hypothetical protein